jgi:site-specific recombinase XerC
MEDLVLSEAHLRVWGKGRKQRVLPLTADTLQVLQNYLRCASRDEPAVLTHTRFLKTFGPFFCKQRRRRRTTRTAPDH